MTVTDKPMFYAVDFQRQPIQLNDQNRSWIQGLPLGSYEHVIWGEINITPERVARFVKNFHDKVRDTDLDIDYDHKAKDERAAGWVRDVDDRGPDGLWLLIEWTPKAAQALKDKEYRYFSPEFSDEWVHPKSGTKFQDVLFGGALTNRPFLRDIAPINLSELGQYNKQGEGMDKLLKLLSEALGVELSDDEKDTDANLQKIGDAVKELKEKQNEDPKKLDEPEVDDDIKKLAEANPAIAKLLSTVEAQGKQIVELGTARQLSEINVMLSEAEGDLFKLSPALKDELRPTLLKLDEGSCTAVMAVMQKMLDKGGLVQLGELGGNDPAKRQDEDLVKKFHETVAGLQKDNDKLSYGDAVQQIALTEPELFDAYNNAQLARN